MDELRRLLAVGSCQRLILPLLEQLSICHLQQPSIAMLKFSGAQ
jgi:hypothetical protein